MDGTTNVPLLVEHDWPCGRDWPYGVTREPAKLDCWCREIAPSSNLQERYGHDPGGVVEFTQHYPQELGAPERPQRPQPESEQAQRTPSGWVL